MVPFRGKFKKTCQEFTADHLFPPDTSPQEQELSSRACIWGLGRIVQITVQVQYQHDSPDTHHHTPTALQIATSTLVRQLLAFQATPKYSSPTNQRRYMSHYQPVLYIAHYAVAVLSCTYTVTQVHSVWLAAFHLTWFKGVQTPNPDKTWWSIWCLSGVNNKRKTS